MQTYLTLFFLLAVAVMAFGCSGGPTSAGSTHVVDPAQVQELWIEGQHYLAQLGEAWTARGGAPIRGDVFAVKPSRFHFVAHDEPLTLLEEPVGGYFDAGTRSVHFYRPLMDGAIQHEVGHAVLYVLADPRWKCAFHANCQ